ncbi:hypothetical protein RJT34_31295 [Clitoria ternatea]|uniref:Proteasome alpha-type subunits domain-containing protein n=1 Tax=Clitoria ternatea TaxID=43366 RepID=A0AAN9EW71_CLITE
MEVMQCLFSTDSIVLWNSPSGKLVQIEHALTAVGSRQTSLGVKENEYGPVESQNGASGKAYTKWAAQMVVGLDTGAPWVMYTDFGSANPRRPAEDLAFAVARFIQNGGSFVIMACMSCQLCVASGGSQ